MKCYKCKRKIKNDSKFCIYCGAKVESIFNDFIKDPKDIIHINEGKIMLCPNCGNRVDSEKQYTKLRIKCAAKKIHWDLLHYFVYLDNKIIGILHDDANFTYHVLNGSHTVLIRYVHRSHYTIAHFKDIFTKKIDFNEDTNSIDLYMDSQKNISISEDVKNSKKNMPIKRICSNCKHEILYNSSFCLHCGTKLLNNSINYANVVDNEKINFCCPKCGITIDNKKKFATLIIKRKYYKFWGNLIYFNIFLDGKCLGPLADGDYLSCYVSIGNHELRIEPISHLKYVIKGSKNQIITINENTNSVEVVTDAVAVGSIIITSIEYK